ncbi:hypothetical protein C7M61_001484 [Candidozyma pseudohaemuli]|uniref:Nuclear pore complex protein n=1 Tax=Candidozyma pseudohaemuli TaxID=418784 RepID=A0A2P7YUN9_9ASCO|nr:hypothetical protein C7M61_001484 [[Candida] pseudohaemulonii]PSK39682.1 hypothetical protein C7M61_001484 [[Candida] pseudohaemulonii]
MEESTIFGEPLLEPAETQFARVLENYKLDNASEDPFSVVKSFTSISAKIALALNQKGSEEFENWDLETKLWHLFELLYSFRLSEKQDYEVPAYASMKVKRDAHLLKNPKLKEMLLIIQWLQYNTPGCQFPPLTDAQKLKWLQTTIKAKTKSLSAMTNPTDTSLLVSTIDSDAPLRESKIIVKEDADADLIVFSQVYQILLTGDYQGAIDLCNETGNYTLALILLGAIQDYQDPQIDGQADDMDVDSSEPSGIKHKYLWHQTVYKLSQEKGLNHYERLIYTFLSGGDLSENIKFADNNWEQSLLVYLHQLLTYHVRVFVQKNIQDDEKLGSVLLPSPQFESVDGILNTLLQKGDESKNPFRVIMGSVMIDQLNIFLHNAFKADQAEIALDYQILRILTHLAVLTVMLNLHDGSKTPTRIITRYITRLSDLGLEDLVPVYMTFIPDEKDVRECYSIFLATITDPEKRARQLSILNKFEINQSNGEDTPASSATEDIPDTDNKVYNVLKRTVERVMLETEEHYVQEGNVVVSDGIIDPVDVKLYRSVDWLFDKSMYEDAISATKVLMRRFLLTGRIKSVQAFSKNKNFKSLLKDYDFQIQTKSLDGNSPPATISEEDRVELLQYQELVETLNLLDQWRSFVGTDANASQFSDGFWKSKDLEKLIEKTIHNLQKLISTWFKDVSDECTDEELVKIYKEYRSIYIPYFIIELLQVLQQSRRTDWKYMREAFQLINEVADDKANDFLQCFIACGRLDEFVGLAGELSIVASERGVRGIFA